MNLVQPMVLDKVELYPLYGFVFIMTNYYQGERDVVKAVGLVTSFMVP